MNCTDLTKQTNGASRCFSLWLSVLLLLCWILKSKTSFYYFDGSNFFSQFRVNLNLSLPSHALIPKAPRGWRFALADVVFEALGGGHFSSTTVTEDATGTNTFLPESISTHYIGHIKQPALRCAQLWQGGEKILLLCTKGNCDTLICPSAPNLAALQPWTLSRFKWKIYKWINKFLSTFY